MKRLLIAFFAVVAVTFGCRNNGSGDSEEVDNDSVAVDDSLLIEEEDEEIKAAADELFDDFFFYFAGNGKLQSQRVKFPLPVYSPNDTSYIDKENWETEHFFIRQGYYTLLFDNYKEMEAVKDTAIGHVVVERFNLVKYTAKLFNFERKKGAWQMTSITEQKLSDNPNMAFLNFYRKFVSDSIFQMESIHETVEFSGTDPDDDFERMDGIITPDTWPAFAPELPQKTIYNITYGDKQPSGTRKIFLIRGISNGLEVEMEFRIIGGKWKLTKLTT